MKRVLSLLIAVFILLIPAFNKTEIYAAATAAITVSVNNAKPTPGEQVTFTVKYSSSGGNILGYNISFSYSKDIFDFVSCENESGSTKTERADGSVGIVHDFVEAKSSGTVCTVKLKVKSGTAVGKTGTLKIDTATCSPDFLSGGGTATINASKGSASVTVTAPKSSNNNLQSLKINTGTLSPAFSSGTLNYKVTVPNSVSKITVSGAAADSKATVSGFGTVNLTAGKTTDINIKVTAENGAAKTYKISVTREQAATQKPTQTPTSTPNKPTPTTKPPVTTNQNTQTQSTGTPGQPSETPSQTTPSEGSPDITNGNTTAPTENSGKPTGTPKPNNKDDNTDQKSINIYDTNMAIIIIILGSAAAGIALGFAVGYYFGRKKK